MAITFPQVANNGFSASQASLAVSFSAPTSANSIVAVAGSCSSGMTSITVTNDKSNTITPILEYAGLQWSFIWVKVFLNPTTGSQTYTVTFNGGNATYGDMYLWEIAGIANPVVDRSVHAEQDSTSYDSGSSGTLSTANEALVGYMTTGGVASTLAGAWTNDGIQATTGSIGGHQVVAATTALDFSGTTTAINNNSALLASFMQAAATSSTTFPDGQSIIRVRYPLWR